MSKIEILICFGLLGMVAGCASMSPHPSPGPEKEVLRVFDAGGRITRALEVGSSLHVGVRGLQPNTLYEFRLAVNREARSLDDAISFARSSTDREGNIPPFVLWYQSGVVGCDQRAPDPLRKSPFRFRTFDEAQRALTGRILFVSVHAVESDPTRRTSPMKLRVHEALSAVQIPIVQRRHPAIYASDRNGCLLNSQLTGKGDLYVSGRGFKPRQKLEISIVPNQRAWYVNDPINDVTGVGAAASSERVEVDSTGTFTLKVWDQKIQRRGVYDIVGHHLEHERDKVKRILIRDIISYAAETGFILYDLYPVGGPTMDIAGRPVTRSPYFEFADSFAETDDPVWGAVDPTYVPASHPGGSYAAYYVVNHRDVMGWNPAMSGSINLVDVSGGIEIHPVKAGCVNGTDVIIWNSPLNVGDYDVVVDFGSTVASSPATFLTDGEYNEAKDFLDGANQIGFVVAKDPYDFGPMPIGQDSYSQDNFFATLGSRANVDLRAVIRYPATVAGVGTPGKSVV